MSQENLETESSSSKSMSQKLLEGFVTNFAGFSVVAVIMVAMVGVGVAEESGLMTTLIRKIVQVTPRRAITFILVFFGVLSSVATTGSLQSIYGGCSRALYAGDRGFGHAGCALIRPS